jgi:hypothetical protein
MGDSAYKPPSGQMNDTLDAGLGNLVGAQNNPSYTFTLIGLNSVMDKIFCCYKIV